MPALNEDCIRQPATLVAQLINNLGVRAGLNERYEDCVRAYPAFQVPLEEFRAAVANAAVKYLGISEAKREPSVRDLERFISELQLADLYLGLACLRGDENAWAEFDQSHRPFIERCARQLAHADVDAEEIIDLVYVDLFGSKIVDGVRQSKFRTYTGRGTLRGWLRTIILHAAVDLSRASKNEIAMDDWQAVERATSRGVHVGKLEESILSAVVGHKYEAAALSALDQALGGLHDHEMLLLLYYHVEGLKLREIARIAEQPQSPILRWFQRRGAKHGRVHESTVMRWLEKIYLKVAERFSAELTHRHGLKSEEIEICKAIVAHDKAQAFDLAQMNSNVTRRKNSVSTANARSHDNSESK